MVSIQRSKAKPLIGKVAIIKLGSPTYLFAA
jgi:hypothetical protein